MPIRLLIATIAVMAVITTGCGGGNSNAVADATPPPAPPSGLLIAPSSDDELLASVRDGFTQIADNNLLRMADMASDSAEASTSADNSFSTTYTLESSVDEHDVVKYDGQHLFIAPSRGMDCCMVMEDTMVPEIAMANAMTEPSTGEAHSIRILATNPSDGGASQVSSIDLSDHLSIEGLYVGASQLVAIGSSGYWGGYGDSFSRIANWASQTTALYLYDIADISAPTPQLTIEFEGGLVNSRKKGDMVYLVARHTPEIGGLVYYPNDQQAIENERLLASITLADIVPKIVIDGAASPLVAADDCLIADDEHPLSPGKNGVPTMTLLVAINLVDRQVARARCYLEPTNGIYVSENALYLSQIDYTETPTESSSRTLVHRFELSPDMPYQGSGAADGALYLSGSKDFRINEHDGYLRLVTSQVNPGNIDDNIEHTLTILALNADDIELDVIATLPNAQRPEAIGKPNEQLYGARFMGEVPYLVTFERIDPLYVIDLSTPTDPLIAGELMVTGFSDFLHAVNDDLLMGLGQDENGLIKLELFNVADMTAPYSLGGISLGEGQGATGGYSEARYNRHAFTYLKINDSQDRFLVPATLSFNSADNDYRAEDSLYLFELNSKDNPALASIDMIGKITAKQQSWHRQHTKRSIIHDDAVYFIDLGADSTVWSALWSNPNDQKGPL
jgi:uncharacterized secreted protein with C-terminal beta-propeller domain